MTTIPEYVIQRIRHDHPDEANVIPGSTPVICFGDPSRARVATIGSNPGPSAFLEDGKLTSRYFETLESLQIATLRQASAGAIERICARCVNYFSLPYHRQWFGPQKEIVKMADASYLEGSACHLDLVQWATRPDWNDLSREARRKLLAADTWFLREQLENSTSIEVLLLNGKTVLRDFSNAFEQTLVPAGHFVDGNVTLRFFTGELPLGRRVLHVIGWDKNLQGSFGITRSLKEKVLERLSDLYGESISKKPQASMHRSTIQERLNWEITPDLYQAIRALWIKHSKAEDARDLQGLIETLAPDCVYEVVPTGQLWEGHDGARQFYLSFLGAFPDVKFNMSDIVIGPQGVFEVTEMTGTHRGPWAGVAPTGKPVRLRVIIHFPWNPQAGKFAGERIYFDRAALAEQL